jgi:hypothetical protein
MKRPYSKLARWLRSLLRTKLGVLIGLLTSHIQLNEYLHRMDLFYAAFGLEEETAFHFICILDKPILSVGEYEEKSVIPFLQFIKKSGRF